MIPNGVNAPLTLVDVKAEKSPIGEARPVISGRKRVLGMIRSVTAKEYGSSVSTGVRTDFKVVLQAPVYDGSKYVLLRGRAYRVERTYQEGQFIDLYLTSSDLSEEELDGADRA